MNEAKNTISLNLKKKYKGFYQLEVDSILITVAENPMKKNSWEGIIETKGEILKDFSTGKMVQMYNQIEDFEVYYGKTKKECCSAIINFIQSL